MVQKEKKKEIQFRQRWNKISSFIFKVIPHFKLIFGMNVLIMNFFIDSFLRFAFFKTKNHFFGTGLFAGSFLLILILTLLF